MTGDGNDAILGIENLTGSAHDDVIVGDDADNVLDGGAGPRHGLVRRRSRPGDRGPRRRSATGDGTDSIAGFEDLIGSANGDQLRGDGADNRIDGGGGDDS